MCKCCNLFSPNQSELLSHVSEKHGDEGVNADDIIIPLRPLSTPEPPNPSRTGDEFLVMKRKRGRPKGSTKKPSAEEELVENLVNPSEEGPLAPEEGAGLAPSSLECGKCCRKFSNTRQLRKHICIIVLNLGEEEGEAGNESDLELEKKCKDDDREKAPKRPRVQKTEKVQKISGKEAGQLSGAKKPIISVVLTAHEAIPGATKIIPVEAGPPETGAANPETTAADLVPRRGYQEYAIQQTPYEQPMKSSRLGPTQLKIFTCEYCNKVFKFKHSLQAHLRIHTNEKPYKCPQCSYASAIKANLNVHLRKHTGEKFACDYCSFTCLSKGHLKVHIERVHKKIKQHCRFCKKKYSDVKNLIKHIRDTHDPQDKKVKEALDELRLMTREGKRQLLYDCHICERKFKNELDRDRHMLVHGDKWPFACELCGHGATKYQALELHVRKHPFVYVCAICLKKFVSSIRLRSHIKEVHGAAQEALVFTSSINQSFCLLEPGGDIQQEALGDQLQLVEEECVCQGMDVLKEEACPVDAQQEEGQKELEVPVQMPDSAVPLGTTQAESTALSPCELETTVVTSDLHSLAVVSDDFLLKNDASSPEAAAAAEKTLGAQHGGSAQTQGQEVTLLLPKAKSAGPTQETEHAESPPREGQKEAALAASEPDPSRCLRSNPAEAADLLPQVADSGDILCHPDSCKPASEHRPGSTAFMKVLDSLQKKQMNTGLCERIRKVYGDLECEYCGKLFWYQVHFDMHVRTHTREHLYYCSQCHYSSITKNCLKRHVIQKHSNILLKCPTDGCDYSTPDKYKLQAHLKVHTELDKRSYSCPVCEKSFSEDRLIKSHIKTNHPEVSMNTISEVLGRRVQLKGLIGKRAMKCPYCDFYFMKNGSDLQRHIWAHEGVKPFKCSLCEYATRSKSNLKAHMNRHSTEKTHLCDMCGKKFKSKGTLKSHKLLHTADGKQFKCTVCDYTAAQKPQLLRHMEQHASFKPFRCAHCHYSCNISGSLKRHYNRKHPNEEYANAGSGELAAEALIQQGGLKCPVCSFVYGTKWEFNRHLKNKHGLKVVEIDGDPKWEVTDEEPSSNHTVMIQETLQQASVELAEQHHLVVSSDDVEGIETVTVYTQGGEASEFIVYVQEAVQPVEEQAEAQPAPEL
uniref:Zinc finger protein ZFAT n=1 Tax=Sciurus vulgaris TaxID=55149 RepID=A0A8D2DB03_SCIVU